MAHEPLKLTPEQEEQKRFMYEKMSPRRRKFVDRIGYENWDPYPMPKDPVEIRVDPTRRTTQDLVNMFLGSRRDMNETYSSAYASGALECALGLVNGQDRIVGMFQFSLWYAELLKQEGVEYDPAKAMP